MQRKQSLYPDNKNISKVRPDTAHNLLNHMIKKTKASVYPSIRNNQNVRMYL